MGAIGTMRLKSRFNACPSLVLVGLALCLLSPKSAQVCAFLVPSQLSAGLKQGFNRHRVLAYAYGGAGGGGGRREAEIRRKIAQLKKEGRLKKQSSDQFDEFEDDFEDDVDPGDVMSIYGDKVKEKLGDKKSKLLGFTGSNRDAADGGDDAMEETGSVSIRSGQIGSLPTTEKGSPTGGYVRPTDSGKTPIIDPSLFEDDNEKDDELAEDVMVDMVAQKLREKRERERKEKEQRLLDDARQRLTDMEEKQKEAKQQSPSGGAPAMTTSGVGGSWKKNETTNVEMYQPKTGSWGAFPRPKDISKAYGGGRRVGPGYSTEESRLSSAEQTRERLRAYRERAGIEVQSEKDHAGEIEEALRIGGLAMSRGLYSTAVSALEKVTRYCSTNSKVGGKVFLELGMAYEAVGRTDEAITVYTTLSRSRIEETKFDAKRLLYGIEAMQFMRNEMKDSNFSRKKARNTFIDTTGLGNIAQNFDDVYQTAYVDLEGSFYKRLSESVVRSPREARQILLRATGAGEVARMRIVQALRSLSRNFEEALEKEIERNTVKEPVAVMDGKPIVARRAESDDSFGGGLSGSFVLADSDQMEENLSGEWRLQLLADKRGDGVKFFNNTLSWQQVDMDKGKFVAKTPVGFANVQLSGAVEFNQKKRVLRRRSVETTGGGVFAALVDPLTGVSGAVRVPQQVMTVDSTLLVTRGVPSKQVANKDDEKEYFAVWRRVDQ